MDLKGSLVSTNLKIFPSKEMIKYLENEKFTDDIPVNIRKLINREDSKVKNNQQDELKPLAVHLNDKDFENLNKVKNILSIDEVKTSESEQIEDNEVECLEKNSLDSAATKIISNSLENETIKDGAEKDAEGPFLTTSDIDWLYVYLKEKRKKGEEGVPYLHVLLEGSYIELPENEVIKRNPELEARCVKLRAQQEAREYRKMTKSVDNVRINFPEDSISYQMKQLNRQLIAIGQFIISIFAGFLFGFKGVEWMVGPLDFGFKLLLGVMCALIIALAEIYFLAKKLNEELNVPETTQLGGPPKFVDEKLYDSKVKKSIDKPHQD